MSSGYLALVLHAHLPFVRHPEHEEFLEEDWLFEAITETYYSFPLSVWRVTLDYQFVNNPGYNRDRGPVSIAGIRLHAQF